MTADSADIRFECTKCGQHLVVEAAGAGLTADCPICNTSVTVPLPPAQRKARRADGENSPEGRVRNALRTTPLPGSLRSPYADPLPEELHEELIDASLINGKLVRDLEKAREEVARLQGQLKAVGEDFEHLNASTTHSQAELKTFQTERQQLKAEISSLRQKITSAEEALAAREGELKELRPTTAASLAAAERTLAETRSNETGRAAEWEAKAGAAKKEAEKATRKGEERKAKAKAAETALSAANQLVAERNRELKAAETAAQQVQKTVADFRSKTGALEQALAVGRAEGEKLAAALTAKAEELAGAEAHARTLDEELHKTRGRLGEAESALTSSREEKLRLVAEREDRQRQLEEAKSQLAPMADLQTQCARAEAQLREHQEKLRVSEESNQTLAARCEQLRRETDSLRRDVTESHSGRELVETRSRLDDAVAERDRAAARLSVVEADLQAFSSAEIALRSELERARRERDDAVERVEALRETRAAKDNQVLRGIIARLNADLALRTSEVLRAKRARFGLKIAYVLFGCGLLGVLVVALKVLPHALRP